MSKKITSAQLQEALAKADNEEKIKAVANQAVDAVKALEEADQSETLNATIAGHVATIKALEDSKAEIEAQYAEALDTITELGEKLNLMEENRGNPNLIVSIDKKEYEIIGNRFVTKEGTFTAVELSKNKELMKQLIAKGSGAIVLKSDK